TYRDRVERLVDETGIDIITVESDRAVDDILVEMAGEYVVCTNDAEVRRELRARDLPHIYLRGKTHLAGENLRTALSF
ncbi:MAG: hypothetical protein ABEK12_00895, partial [Candidatus Nanohaloarchaea archaeon]